MSEGPVLIMDAEDNCVSNSVDENDDSKEEEEDDVSVEATPGRRDCPPPLPQISFTSVLAPAPAPAPAPAANEDVNDSAAASAAIMDPAILKIVEDRASRGSSAGGHLTSAEPSPSKDQQHQQAMETVAHHHHHSDQSGNNYTTSSITFFGKGIPKHQPHHQQQLLTSPSPTPPPPPSSSNSKSTGSTDINNNKSNNTDTNQGYERRSSPSLTDKNSDDPKKQVTGTSPPGAYASRPGGSGGNDPNDIVDAALCSLNNHNNNNHNNNIDVATTRTTITSSSEGDFTSGNISETDGGSSSDTFHHSSGSLHGVASTIQARLVTMEEEDAEKLQLDNQKLREQLQVVANAPKALIVVGTGGPADDDDDDDDDHRQSPKTTTRRRRKVRVLIVVGGMVLICLVLAVIVAILFSQGDSGSQGGASNDVANHNSNISNSDNTNSPSVMTTLQQPTLQTARDRGYIKCRVSPTDHKRGFGISLELCKAMSAAIFAGDPNRTEFFVTPLTELWDGIDTGRFDIGSSWATNHMGRDVYEAKSQRPKSFSIPFYFTGVQVAGHPDFVDCVDRRDTLTGICKDLVICVVRGSSTSSVIQEHFDGPVLHMLEHSSDTFLELASGTSCNVIAGKPQYIYEDRARDAGYTGDYVLGSTFLSREPQSMVLREDDPQWTDFANSILQALFTAEMENITKENATLFPLTNLFGEDLQTMYQDVIAAVGNWGDLYDRTFGQTTARSGMNLLKLTDADSSGGGLLYSAPLSALRVDDDGDSLPALKANGTLETISERGYLRCGVIPNRPGFAEESHPNSTDTILSGMNTQAWSGMDVDVCRCLAAALFADPTLVEFVELGDQVAGFMALEEDLVDVFSGATYTLGADIQERHTHRGYSFSPIYFYGKNREGMLALATNQKSTQWSDFVKWAVYGLIHAEEESIGREEASNMPAVDLFGPSHKLMFRLIVLHLGSYGDVYNRNLGALIPRQGSNLLNDGMTPLIKPLPIDQFI